jgi:hypothetical protein
MVKRLFSVGLTAVILGCSLAACTTPNAKQNLLPRITPQCVTDTPPPTDDDGGTLPGHC